MAFIDDGALDAALNDIRTMTDSLHITDQQVTAYANLAASTLGNKAAPTINAPANATPDGRAITIAALSDGTVTATGTASHWCLVDGVNSDIKAAGSLSATQVVTSGNSFSLGSFDIRFPDAVS